MSTVTHTILHQDTAKVKRDYWRRVQSVRDRFEVRFHSRFRSIISGQFKALAEEITSDNFGTDQLIDKIITVEPVYKGYTELYSAVGVHFAEQAYQGLKYHNMSLLVKADEKEVDQWYEFMRGYVRTKAGERIKAVTRVTRDQAKKVIRPVLDNSVIEGWGSQQTATAIREALKREGEVLANWRALRIARTEIVTASNIGAMEGARTLNYPLEKFWIATYDNRTRDTHLQVEQQNPKAMDDKFIVGAYSMDMPGDPTAGPEETINCRCTVAFQVKGL